MCGEDRIIFLDCYLAPAFSNEDSEGCVNEAADKHIVLVDAVEELSDRTVACIDLAHRSRSIEFHSFTVDSQKPRKKARETDTEVIAKRMSAISVASACCTRGLSDIQKPMWKMILVRLAFLRWMENGRRTVEYTLP